MPVTPTYPGVYIEELPSGVRPVIGVAAGEGPPEFASGPIDFFALVFDGASDRTITVDLTEGQWVLQTPDPEQPFEGDPVEDPYTILVTVS